MATDQERQEVRQAVDAWVAASISGDPNRMKSLWDQQYPNLVYVAEENEFPIEDWAGIADYYADILDGVSEDRACSYEGLVLDVFGETSYAECRTITQAGRSPRMEYVSRVTFIFRKVGGQWKIIHYHESANPTIGADGYEIS
jgi:ketosteroid isomerase-like protein